MKSRVILLGVLLILGASPAWALRCNGRVVQEGDHAFDVQRKCGAPAYADSWDEYAWVGAYGGHVEDWFYNFGPSRLVQILHFRNSRLTRIDSGGYGYTAQASSCSPHDIHTGQNQFDLVMRCGPPASRERRFDYRSPRFGDRYYGHPVSTRVE